DQRNQGEGGLRGWQTEGIRRARPSPLDGFAHSAFSIQHSALQEAIPQNPQGDSRGAFTSLRGRFRGAFVPAQNSQPHQTPPLAEISPVGSEFFRAPLRTSHS